MIRAARIHRYGEVGALSVEQVDTPQATPGEVVVRVASSSVNPFDCAVRAGYVQDYFPYTFPLTLGLDLAGVVEQVGDGVTDWVVGDEVIGQADPARLGANAEAVAVAADRLAPRPATMPLEEAGGLPHVGITAWRSLFDAAGLTSGQSVLVHAGSGGVGHLAVQLAKSRGARVVATTSGPNVDLVVDLGADQVIDYTAGAFEEVVSGMDVVLDAVGGDVQDRSWTVLAPGGVLVSIVSPPSPDLAEQHGVRAAFPMSMEPPGEVLRQLGALVDDGLLRLVVADTLPLSELARAHTLSETRRTVGKLLLRP